MNAKIYKGYLYAILSAVIFGCVPLMAKHIYADGVSPLTLVFLRNLLALPSLALFARIQSRTLAVPLRSLPSIAMIALIGCCVTPMLLFSSYQYIASGTATVFHFIYPSIVVLAGIAFLRKKAQLGSIVSVIICCVGVALFYAPGQPLDPFGSFIALFSGVTYATYTLLLSMFRYKDITGFRFSFHVAALASIFTFIAALVGGQLAFPGTLTGWIMCFVFAFLVTTGAVMLYQQATFLIGGERTSILSTLEPTTSVIVGILVFNEPLSLRTVTGSVLVILASLLIALFDIKSKKTAE